MSQVIPSGWKRNLADLHAWRKDNYAAWQRGEITEDEYRRVKVELEAEALKIHAANQKRSLAREQRLKKVCG